MDKKEPTIHSVVAERGSLLTLENRPDENNIARHMEQLAHMGAGEGYTLYNDTPQKKNAKTKPLLKRRVKGLHLSVILRPTFHSSFAGLLGMAVAVSLAQTIENMSECRVRIHPDNKLYIGRKKVAAYHTKALFRENGFLDYVIVSLAIATHKLRRKETLSTLVERVFHEEITNFLDRLAKEWTRDFFSLYLNVSADRSFLAEYESRSMLIGRKRKMLVDKRVLRGEIVSLNREGRFLLQTKNDGILPWTASH